MFADELDRDQLADFEPLAQRAATADAGAFIRLRQGNGLLAGFVQLPYDVIAGRTIASNSAGLKPIDVTFLAHTFAQWFVDDTDQPPRRDAHWLSALPPTVGWRRIEKVPDSAIREVVRSGALLAREITAKNAQGSLLGSTVLTATAANESVDVPLRALTALTKMGFLPRGSEAAVDVASGWLRVAATYGSTYIATQSNVFSLSAR